MGNRRKKALLLIYLGIHIQSLADIFHKRLLVIGIIDCEIRIKSNPVNVSAQNPYTG